MKFRKSSQETTRQPEQVKKPGLFKKLGYILEDLSVVEPIELRTDEIAAEAREHAQGPNQTVVELAEIYRKAAEKNSIGIFSQQFDNKDRKRLHPTNMWSVLLWTQENASRKPGMRVKELPEIVIQNEVVKVNDLTIALSSADERVSSTIWINDLAGLVDAKKDFDRPPRFGNAFRIDVGADGGISFGRESDRSSGFTDVSFTEHTLTGFLEQVAALPELEQ